MSVLNALKCILFGTFGGFKVVGGGRSAVSAVSAIGKEKSGVFVIFGADMYLMTLFR